MNLNFQEIKNKQTKRLINYKKIKKMKKSKITLLVLFMAYYNAQGQDFCIAPSPTSSSLPLKKSSSDSPGSYKLSSNLSTTYAFRIYVHVVRRANGTGGQSVEAVKEAISFLNNDFRPYNIYFTWDKSIDYIDSDILYNPSGNDDDIGKPHYVTEVFKKNKNEDGIDIYLFDDDSGLNAGLANFWGNDRSSQILVSGKLNNNSLIRSHVTSHEMGHMFQLFHTHETFDNTRKELVDGSNSKTHGDQVVDTPADPGLRTKDPITGIRTTNVDLTTCKWTKAGLEKDANGDLYAPDTKNIMSYTQPECMEYFTLGQGTRMREQTPNIFFLKEAIISFDWENATANASTITQDVASVTAKFTSSSNSPSLIDGGDKGGTSGKVATSKSGDTYVTISFPSAINVQSLRAYNVNSSAADTDWTFTPTGGANSNVVANVGPSGKTVSLDWKNVTEIKITSSAGGDYFGIDKVVFNTINVWEGTTDTDWSKATNWSTGAVPTNISNVSVPSTPANQPIIDASVSGEVNDITIATNTSLTIKNGGSIIVKGTAIGNVTYIRHLPTSNNYLISSPVAGQIYNDAYVTANSIDSGKANKNNRGIATYITNTNEWNYLQAGASGTFIPGIGYRVKRSSAGNVSFTGTLNTNDITSPVVSSGGGFNLLGNPYPSHINSATFLKDNTANLSSQTIWVWNQAIDSYETKVSILDFILAPTQGFFVKARTNANLTFDATNQLSSGGTFQKSNKTEIKLSITDGTHKRFARVLYIDGATKGLDDNLDGETFTGKLISGIDNPLDVFTHLVKGDSDKNYQVQSLPDSDFENMIIPVGIKAKQGKEITFTAEALNLPLGTKVFLEDRLTNRFTRLNADSQNSLSDKNAQYKIMLDETVNEFGRFYLHTVQKSSIDSGALPIESDVLLNNINVYKSNSTTLKIIGLPRGRVSVKMYNLLGKKVMKSAFETNGIEEIILPKLFSGIYIVRLKTKAGRLNKKIIIE